jgi:two-component system response regulator
LSAKTILLVEDNPDDEALTIRAFDRSGIANKLVVARDGVEALETIFGKGGEGGTGPLALDPSVILLDLKLPKVDGLEVLKRLRADPRSRVLPVVILTSSREDRDIVESYRGGANSYVRKPVDFAEFAQAIRELGLYWLVLNERVDEPRRRSVP